MEVDKENAAPVTPPRPVIDLTGVQPDSDGDVERFRPVFTGRDFASKAVEHGGPLEFGARLALELANEEIVFFILNWNVSTWH